VDGGEEDVVADDVAGVVGRHRTARLDESADDRAGARAAVGGGAVPAPVLEEHGDGDLPVLRGGERDHPRVLVLLVAGLRRAVFPATVTPGTAAGVPVRTRRRRS
jgi:hypothetical protein